jgi:hypothetical protein
MTIKFHVMLLSLVTTMAWMAVAQAQPGPGMGGMPGAGWRAGQGNTPGFALMSDQERMDHQNRMRSLRSYDECLAYVGEHHAQMAVRAQARGIALPAPRNPCDMMQRRGRIQ